MINLSTTSTPTFSAFNPKLIPYQYRVIYDVNKNYDYSIGPAFVLLSGSIGSAKSALMAWLGIQHCIENDGALVLLGRKTLPDLKETIFQKIIEMLDGTFIEGVDYKVNWTNYSITFKNGSKIISRSWSDRKFKKFRSLELSMIIVEELTENDRRDWEFFIELIGRLGRRPHIKTNLFIAATNPDDPSHPAYEFFIKNSIRVNKTYAHKPEENIHTYFSRTEQNPFLPSWYISSLRKKYDAKMIKRLLEGEWLYISTDVIYYCYNPEKHYILENTKPDKELPLRISFDFNIQKNKPNSSCLLQYNPQRRFYTFIDEVAIEGARTSDSMDEWQGKGYFDLPHNPQIIIHGDQTGTKNDTRGVFSDYDIIEKYLANYVRKDGQVLSYEIEIPSCNPPIRDRHNKSNGQLEDANGKMHVAVDKRCIMIDKGFSNTRLKEGASYLEDQTTEGQDISTACTYAIWFIEEYGTGEPEDIEFY